MLVSLSVGLFVCFSVCLFLGRFCCKFVCIHIYPSVCLSDGMFVWRYVCLSIWMYVCVCSPASLWFCMFVCLYVSFDPAYHLIHLSVYIWAGLSLPSISLQLKFPPQLVLTIWTHFLLGFIIFPMNQAAIRCVRVGCWCQSFLSLNEVNVLLIFLFIFPHQVLSFFALSYQIETFSKAFTVRDPTSHFKMLRLTARKLISIIEQST